MTVMCLMRIRFGWEMSSRGCFATSTPLLHHAIHPLQSLTQGGCSQVPDGVILEPTRRVMTLGEVIVADNQGFQSGTLFAMKLQEMGGTVLQAIQKEAIMKMMQDATMGGRRITAVFVLDGMVSAQVRGRLETQREREWLAHTVGWHCLKTSRSEVDLVSALTWLVAN